MTTPPRLSGLLDRTRDDFWSISDHERRIFELEHPLAGDVPIDSWPRYVVEFPDPTSFSILTSTGATTWAGFYDLTGWDAGAPDLDETGGQVDLTSDGPQINTPGWWMGAVFLTFGSLNFVGDPTGTYRAFGAGPGLRASDSAAPPVANVSGLFGVGLPQKITQADIDNDPSLSLIRVSAAHDADTNLNLLACVVSLIRLK